MRFAFFTGLGLVADTFLTGGLGTLTGMGLGATDSFLLDKLIGGWKPHQFINYSLKPTICGKKRKRYNREFGG
jgi:hypothetical protein